VKIYFQNTVKGLKQCTFIADYRYYELCGNRSTYVVHIDVQSFGLV